MNSKIFINELNKQSSKIAVLRLYLNTGHSTLILAKKNSIRRLTNHFIRNLIGINNNDNELCLYYNKNVTQYEIDALFDLTIS
jgi:hypothetical protein